MLHDLAQVLAQRDPDALQRLGRTGVRDALRPLAVHAASGPSTARITSATVISAAGRFSRCRPRHRERSARCPAWRRSERMFSRKRCGMPCAVAIASAAPARRCAGRRRARRRREPRSRPWRRPSRAHYVFQRAITRVSRSNPSSEIDAVSSAKLAPRSAAVDPAGGEHAQDVAVGEDRDVAAGGQRAGDHAAARSPAWASISPPGEPSRHSVQPGPLFRISGVVRPRSRRSRSDEVGVDCGSKPPARRLARTARGARARARTRALELRGQPAAASRRPR